LPGDFPFGKLVADGRAAGLWGGSRAIRHPAYAFDDLYESFGITPEIYARKIANNRSVRFVLYSRVNQPTCCLGCAATKD
jgi:hypothetical protein